MKYLDITGLSQLVTKIKTANASKMDKANPVGTGTLSLNRVEGLLIGNYSVAEGQDCGATGDYSHAEGQNTIAAGEASHVQGKYNIEDSSSTYAHIVGNGSNSSLSNAHTLDWSGNAWYAGDVYVGSTSGTNKDAGSEKLIKASELSTLQTQVNNLTSNHLEITIADSLPTLSTSTDYNNYKTKLYLIAHDHIHPSFLGTDGEQNDSYDEFVAIATTVNSTTTYSWEKIGNTDIDLSDYVSRSDYTSDTTVSHSHTISTSGSHNHSFTGTALETHSHTFNGTAHSHSISSNGGHTPSGTLSTSGSHSHNFTGTAHGHNITNGGYGMTATYSNGVITFTNVTMTVGTTTATGTLDSQGGHSHTFTGDAVAAHSHAGVTGNTTPTGTLTAVSGGTPTGTISSDGSHNHGGSTNTVSTTHNHGFSKVTTT